MVEKEGRKNVWFRRKEGRKGGREEGREGGRKEVDLCARRACSIRPGGSTSDRERPGGNSVCVYGGAGSTTNLEI